MLLFGTSPLSFPMELEWRGWVVCGLLVVARLVLFKFRSFPPDVVYSVTGLATAYIGALSSSEIRTALTNPMSLGLIIFALLMTLIRSPFREVSVNRLIASIPWSSALIIFSAYLFYFACERSFLSTRLALLLLTSQAVVSWAPFALLFCSAWGLGIMLPAPIGFGILISVATAMNRIEPFSLITAGLCIGSGAFTIEIIKRFRKWKSQVGIRFGSY